MMCSYGKKVLTCLLTTLALFGFIVSAFGDIYYSSASNVWDFQNYGYLDFNQAINFADNPHLGISYDSNLVGYWNFDEGSGTVAYDSSGNANNGTIINATWIQGKYGTSLEFNGMNTTVKLASVPLITSSYSVSFWFKPLQLNKTQSLINLSGTNSYPVIYLYNYPSGTNRLLLFCGNSIYLYSSKTFTTDDLNNWWQAVFIVNGNSSTNWKLYINGADNTGVHADSGSYYEPSSLGSIGSNNGGAYFNGTIDDVRIYNCALSPVDVATLFSQSNPASFANYYSYEDPVTNNTMAIHVNSPNANSTNIALVTCTNFFADNKLAFQANNSATVNVWTNLGQPVFTTGVWNSNNYTATLTLDAASIGELNWNTYNITTYADAHSGVSPSNVTVDYGGVQTLSFNASQGYRFNVVVDGVSQGQISSYTFSNVTGSHLVNVTSALLKYTVSASADLGSTISPSGDVSVNYGGSQLFTIQNKTGYNVTHVYVDNVDKGAISNYTFSNVKENHVISVSSESLSSTNSPSPTPTSQQETNQFPTQTAAIAATAIAALVAVFALAFKKGYITIEVVEENPEGSEDKSEDYTI